MSNDTPSRVRRHSSGLFLSRTQGAYRETSSRFADLASKSFFFRGTSIPRSRRTLVKMMFLRSRRAPRPEFNVWVALVNVFGVMSVPNLIRALVAILFWSVLIGAVCLGYELWRLNPKLKWGII